MKVGGVWKIKALHRFTTYVAPYEKGWSASTGQPDISIAAQGFPSDRPPTFDYQPFPGVYIPPYHPQPYAPPNDPLLKGMRLAGDTPFKLGPWQPSNPNNPPAAAAAAPAASQGGGQ